jgi:hypothetical protein
MRKGLKGYIPHPTDTFSVACQPLGKHCEAVGDLPTVIVTVGLINGLSHLNHAASGNFGLDADKGYDKSFTTSKAHKKNGSQAMLQAQQIVPQLRLDTPAVSLLQLKEQNIKVHGWRDSLRRKC